MWKLGYFHMFSSLHGVCSYSYQKYLKIKVCCLEGSRNSDKYNLDINNLKTFLVNNIVHNVTKVSRI